MAARCWGWAGTLGSCPELGLGRPGCFLGTHRDACSMMWLAEAPLAKEIVAVRETTGKAVTIGSAGLTARAVTARSRWRVGIFR